MFTVSSNAVQICNKSSSIHLFLPPIVCICSTFCSSASTYACTLWRHQNHLNYVPLNLVSKLATSPSYQCVLFSHFILDDLSCSSNPYWPSYSACFFVDMVFSTQKFTILLISYLIQPCRTSCKTKFLNSVS